MTQEAVTDADLEAALGGGGGEGPAIVAGMTLVNVATGEQVRIAVDEAGNITTQPSGGPEPGDTADRALRRPPLRPGVALNGLFTTLDGFAFQLSGGQVVGAPRSLTASERVQAGLPGAVATGGALTVDEQIRLLQEQQRLAIGQGDHERAADFKNQIEILQKQQDFTFKVDRLNALDNLTTQILGLQQQARTSGIEAIGRDPFRGAIQAQGGTAIGRSPFERLRREQLDFAAAEIPAVGAGAPIQEVEGAIDAAQGLIKNIPQRPIGLAHGGTVQVGAGGFTNIETGEVGDHLIVGESGVERIDMSNGLITVTPQAKQAKGGLKAADGGTFSHPVDEQFGVNTQQFGLEAQSRAQTLFPLFEALGFDQVPLIRRDASGGLGDVLSGPTLGSLSGEFGATFGSQPIAADPVDVFGRLGTRPRLIFDPDLGLFIQINEDTGQIQILGDLEQAVSQFNINPADAVTMTVRQAREAGFGGGQNASRRQESLIGSGRGTFAEQAPIVSPLDIGQTVGILLPDPRMIAAVWNTLDIRTQDAVFSAYGLAGINEGQLEERIRFFTPQGQTVRGGGGAFDQRAGRVAIAAGLPSAA